MTESSILHKKRKCLFLTNNFCHKHGHSNRCNGLKCNDIIIENIQSFDSYFIISNYNVHENQKINLNDYFDLPNLLKCKTFYYRTNLLVSNIPDSIENLQYIGNNQICDLITNLTNLKKISFGKPFNQPVNNLPNCVKYIEFSSVFNKPVDNLPNSITYIKFGGDFNQSVDNLPESLLFVEFGVKFNQDIINLPINIETIKLNINTYRNKTSSIAQKIFKEKIVWKY
jgi:hypothetical protein